MGTRSTRYFVRQFVLVDIALCGSNDTRRIWRGKGAEDSCKRNLTDKNMEMCFTVVGVVVLHHSLGSTPLQSRLLSLVLKNRDLISGALTNHTIARSAARLVTCTRSRSVVAHSDK